MTGWESPFPEFFFGLFSVVRVLKSFDLVLLIYGLLGRFPVTVVSVSSV